MAYIDKNGEVWNDEGTFLAHILTYRQPMKEREKGIKKYWKKEHGKQRKKKTG